MEFSIFLCRLKKINLLLVITFLLTACGGGGGGGGGDGDQQPTSLTQPDYMYVYQGKTASINVLENDSSRNSITITDFSQGSKGTVQKDDNGVFTYIPNLNQFGDDSYTYTVSEGSKQEVQIVNVMITRWQAANMINIGRRFGVYDQNLAIDNTGKVTVVWSERVSRTTGYQLLSRQFQPNTGWLSIKNINTPNSSSQTNPRPLVDSLNNVTVIWDHDGVDEFDVYTNRFDNIKETWGNYQKLNSTNQDSFCRMDIIDQNDMITSFWAEGSFGQPETIVAKRYDSINILPQTDVSNRGVTSYNCRAKQTSTGEISVVWNQLNNQNGYSVWLNQFSNIGGWSGPNQLMNVGSYRDNSNSLDYDGVGNIFTAWLDYNETGVWATRNQAGSGLDAISQLRNTDKISDLIGVFADSTGSALVIWSEAGNRNNVFFPNLQSHDIYSAKFHPVQGWGPAVRVSRPGKGVFDASAKKLGNKIVLAASEGNNSTYNDVYDANIVIYEFNFVTGWSQAQILSPMISSTKSHVYSPKITNNSTNEAVLLWPEKKESKIILWASRRDSLGNWTKAIKLDTGEVREEGISDDVNVVLDANGIATVIWPQVDCSPIYTSPDFYDCWSLWSTQYLPE